jgi:D-alanyl-D-alanine carboxypeptidase
MNRFATRIAASTMVIATAMVGCHTDTIVASTSERTEQQANRLAEQARTALRGGNAAEALRLAERAVELAPRDAGYRMLLADLYLRNGRFRSAETSYSDVLQIDPGNVRAGLSVALAEIAQGRSSDALVQLEAIQDSAPATDVGLAFALAGQPQRAIELLEPAARASGANGRTRQNLALAYALSGDWARARTVAAQDVSPAELGPRLQHWAALAQPSSSHTAVATLLGVTPAEDPGQPVRLALAAPEAVAFAEAAPAAEPTAVAEAPVEVAEAAPAPEPAAPVVEEPIRYAEAIPVPVPAGVPAAAPVQAAEQSGSWWPAPTRTADAAPAPAAAAAPAPQRTAEQPEVRYAAAMQTLSAPSPVLARPSTNVARTARPTFRPSPIVRAAAITGVIPRPGSGTGRFVVQLGAFANPQNAERAWAQASQRFGLANAQPHSATINVGGRTLQRVSIAGFGDRSAAVRLCASIQARGGSCFVRAAAGDSPVRWASRTSRGSRG